MSSISLLQQASLRSESRPGFYGYYLTEWRKSLGISREEAIRRTGNDKEAYYRLSLLELFTEHEPNILRKVEWQAKGLVSKIDFILDALRFANLPNCRINGTFADLYHHPFTMNKPWYVNGIGVEIPTRVSNVFETEELI